jgi:hypothetical protein
MPEAADTATSETDAPTNTEPETDTVDWKAEAEKFKALHKKQEERAKANATAAKELEALRQSAMSETEKAVAEAREAGIREGRTAGLERIVAAEVRAAAAGRGVDIDALLEGVNVARFVTEDGEPDTDAIGSWVERIAPATTEDPRQSPLSQIDLGQGSQPAKTDPGLDAFTRSLVDKVGGPMPSR